jgi:hypothetical protein
MHAAMVAAPRNFLRGSGDLDIRPLSSETDWNKEHA